jgi:hypothetical protein
MMKKYNDFKEDFLLESLLLESKVEFSKGLMNLFATMSNNRIKNILLNLSKTGKDINITQNFFDIGPSKEEITFVQDRRAQQIMGTEPVNFKTTSNVGSHYLTFNKKDDKYVNQSIFNALGFDPDSTSHDVPESNEVGEILSETESKRVPGRFYVLFKWSGGLIVLNKNVVVPNDDRYDRVWALSRNPIRIGRVIRALLTSAGESFEDKEIEDFVNAYKSSIDIMNDAFLKFDVVEGRDIAYWYSNEHYEDGGRSTLGNSCMAEVDSSYFDIYVYNPSVCKLVILYSDSGGQITDGKWKSNKIRGRAILWTTDQGDIFMDRIYYNYESDVDLFKQYADKNDWWYKRSQDSDSHFTAQKGSQTKSPKYTVSLRISEFSFYPYVDTLTYIDFSGKKLSNERSGMDGELCGTGGDWSDFHN